MRTGEGLGAAGDDSYVGYWDPMDRGWMLGERLTTFQASRLVEPGASAGHGKIQMGLQPILLRDNSAGCRGSSGGHHRPGVRDVARRPERPGAF